MNKQKANALTQSQVRDVIEMSVRNKRQRLASEELHKLARKQKVEIVIDAISQPAQVSWSEGWYREYHNMYVIFSKDGTVVFGYDMTCGRMLAMKAGDVKVELMDKLIKNANKAPVYIEMGIPEMENPDGSSAKCARLNYKFGAWYVLEILDDGHFFYVQRKMTAKLQEYADKEGLLYGTDLADKFTSRAKLATVDGENFWSLRCEREGKVCYALYDETSAQFKVTDVAPKIWVLQQRVAWKLIKNHAKANKMALVDTLPFVAMGNGHNVWAMPLISGGYLVCRVRTGEVSFAETITGSLKAKMNGKPFACTLCGFDFMATPWYEAEFVCPDACAEKE